ncbi:MAG: three-Cys-motif partner protein TcmP [Planctomycetaceae bacterium]
MAKRELDEIGPWSVAKLEILRDYAGAYMTVLAKQRMIRRVVYIDAFAGAGAHISKSTGELIPGSPVNALRVEPAFSEFHFIDLDHTRAGRLEKLAGGRPEVHVYHDDCNEVLLNKVFPRCRYEDFARALCLLDPYKLEVDWKVLTTAGHMRSVEIFYNFMIMDANMNMFLRDPDRVRPAEVDRMNAVWGDDSWCRAVRRTQRGLFGDFEEKRTNDAIAEAFRKRLQDVAGFQYVPKPVPMRNSTGAVVYYLYFASPNKIGAKIVGDIFRKYRKEP